MKDHPFEASLGASWSPEGQRRKFIRRYGEEFDRPYGWAAEVVRRKLKKTKFTWYDLRKLADTVEHESRIKDANHSVHADSIGMLQSIDPEGRFHSGASYSGVAEGCLETVRLLVQAADSLLMLWHKYIQTAEIDALRAVNSELGLAMQRDIMSLTPTSE